MKHLSNTFTLMFLSCFVIGSALAEDKLLAPVSVGEMFDKITILEIKTEKFVNPDKKANAQFELASLQETVTASNIITSANSDKIKSLTDQLRQVNLKLWNIEDQLRAKEARKEFDSDFIELARSVYFNNDERCRIKCEINELTGSSIREEKEYVEYA